MKHIQYTLLCLSLILAGCTSTAPMDFVQQIASADHIIVRPTTHEEMILTLSGKKAKDVIRAMYLLKEEHGAEVNTPSLRQMWELEFYAGTNCLGTIAFSDDSVGRLGEYRDHTGTLKRISKAMEAKLEKQLDSHSK